MTTYTVLGVNSEADNCECCGKIDLKRVVWFRNNETGEVKHFGTTCALDPGKGFGLDKQIKAAMSKADLLVERVRQEASTRYRRAGGLFFIDADNRMTPQDEAKWNEIRAKVVAEYLKVHGPVFPTNGN